jgi:hypothetical protein
MPMRFTTLLGDNMIGTITTNATRITKRLSAALAAKNFLRAMGRDGRRELYDFVDHHKYGVSIAKTIRQLERAVSLSTMFKVVERDISVTRAASVNRKNQYQSSAKIEIPLVFRATIPLKVKSEMEVTLDMQAYKVTAITPMPTDESLAAIRQHKGKFDWLELWWVPNEILVEKIPDPDPILVGAIKIPGRSHSSGEVFYFELHRWIDESVEAGWWTKEGY